MATLFSSYNIINQFPFKLKTYYLRVSNNRFYTLKQ